MGALRTTLIGLVAGVAAALTLGSSQTTPDANKTRLVVTGSTAANKQHSLIGFGTEQHSESQGIPLKVYGTTATKPAAASRRRKRAAKTSYTGYVTEGFECFDNYLDLNKGGPGIEVAVETMLGAIEELAINHDIEYFIT